METANALPGTPRSPLVATVSHAVVLAVGLALGCTQEARHSRTQACHGRITRAHSQLIEYGRLSSVVETNNDHFVLCGCAQRMAPSILTYKEQERHWTNSSGALYLPSRKDSII